MKGLALALGLLLALAGCGRAPEAPAPTSTPVPARDQLPTVPIEDERLWDPASCPDCYLLTALPEVDIALYGTNELDEFGDPALFLRYGDAIQPLDQVSLSYRRRPDLAWADYDGDGAMELAAVYCVGYGTGCYVEELHIYEWDGAAWNDCAFLPASYEAQARAAASWNYAPDAGLFSITLDGRAHFFPLFLAWHEDQPPTGDLAVAEMVRFRLDGGTISASIGLGAELAGLPPRVCEDLVADVRYGGQGFTLERPRWAWAEEADAWEQTPLDRLPTEPLSPSPAFDLWQEEGVCHLLARLPEEEIALYGVGSGGLLLRRGGHLQYFRTSWLGSTGYLPPKLAFSDLDGDGARELAVVHDTSGVHSHTEDLTVYEWDGAAWTAHPLTSDRYDALLREAVAFTWDPDSRTATLSCGGTAVTREVDPDYSAPHGLYPFGEATVIHVERGRMWGRFAVGLDNTAMPDYFAQAEADITWDGTDFALAHPVLSHGTSLFD